MALGKLDFPAITKKSWATWERARVYHFDKNDTGKPVYSIDTPPPFTSGALHMGHVLSYAYFDFIARFKRMQGHNVYYPQGWDCQGFPTEVKVEKKFGRGLAREEFKRKCIELSHENIVAMKEQMQLLGFSPDWRFEYKTIDPEYTRRVQYSLLVMFEKNLVYRDKHPVLFCTNCRSAIAKAETDDTPVESLLNFIAFSVEESGEPLEIATTRPDMLHVCQAVFIHPDDPRAGKLKGTHARVPLFNKVVPILSDPDIDQSFGTGAMQVCSYGDKDDVKLLYRHHLPVQDSWGQDGKIVNAGQGFDGLSIALMKEKVLEKLKEEKRLVKQEKVSRTIKTHDRCGKPVDYLATMQWFIKTRDSTDKIVKAGKSMRWVPPFSMQYLLDWAEFIDYDWVISRQRVYGTPLPFYVCEKCGKIEPAEKDKLPLDPAGHALAHPCSCGGKFVGETSTCDCWVDSSITPLAIGHWPDDSEFLARVYPATLRPQGLEIIRTWAFYTIARCLALTGEPPFKEVLINGNVLGKDNKKMSKSLGNYEDPNVLLAKYAPDALRQWAALSGAFARDRPFSYKDVEFSQSFLVKLFNAARFAEKSLEGYDPKTTAQEVELRETDQWMLSRLHQLIRSCTNAFNEFDYYTALTSLHAFVWKEVCDNYLEDVKYRVYEKGDSASRRAAQFTLYHTFNTAVKLLAPFAPFVTEEIYGELFASHEGMASVHATAWPAAEDGYINKSSEQICGVLHILLGEIRRFKASAGVALNSPLSSARIVAPQQTIQSLSSIEEELRSVGHIGTIVTEVGETLSIELTV